MRSILFLLIPLIGACVNKPSSIKPGMIWFDQEGRAINAHGGGVMFHEGTYYWYGEIKEGETYTPECNKSWGGTRVDVTGVSCYSSQNLVDWKYEGNVLPAVTDDAHHDLNPDNVVERPKVVFNVNTQKFVMWMHIDSKDYSKAASGVAVADSPVGPFTYARSFRPNAGIMPMNANIDDSIGGKFDEDFVRGQMARDQTVFVDDDGRAYLFYSSEDNATLHIAELSNDFLRLSGKYQRVFEGRFMEAPAVFKRRNKYYMIASGCTAWEPNEARLAVADSIMGAWSEVGNPCKGEGADKTFNSQSTFVLPVSGKNDAFIFMADRWNKDDLKDSRYVWLPILFEENIPVIRWSDEWDLDVFE